MQTIRNHGARRYHDRLGGQGIQATKFDEHIKARQAEADTYQLADVEADETRLPWPGSAEHQFPMKEKGVDDGDDVREQRDQQVMQPSTQDQEAGGENDVSKCGVVTAHDQEADFLIQPPPDCPGTIKQISHPRRRN
jgi:hypothetical protein